MYIAKIPVIICIILVVLTGCESFKQATSFEGISGQIRWVEGNLMPTPGDANYAQRAKGRPVEREVFIFELVNRKDAISAGGSFYKSVNSRLVNKVKTNKDGEFNAKVPPGTYSVLVLEEEAGFFANMMDGENNLNPITVEPDKFTDIQILINYKAYY